MKRLPAIIFLIVLLFNFYGYRLIIDCVQNKESAAVQSKIDNDTYNDNDLIAIKTVLHLPYYNGSDQYEKVSGSVEVNGVVYNYVKRRVHNDTLELLCLPDHSTMHFQTVKNDFFKLSIEGTSSQQNQKTPHLVKIVMPDYCQEINSFSLASISSPLNNYFSHSAEYLCPGFSRKAEQPPETKRSVF